MSFDLTEQNTAILIAALAGLIVGLLLASLLSNKRRKLAVAAAELRAARAEVDARDVRITGLGRELAQTRDQVRPLSDEVDRYRREAAQRKAAVAAPVARAETIDMSGTALAGGAIAPTVAAEASDELTKLKGVGDRLAAALRDIGVTGYRQIAAWTPEEAVAADTRLGAFNGRIARDQLVEQATLLSAGRTTEYEARFGKIGG